MATSVEEELRQLVAAMAASVSAIESRVQSMEAAQAQAQADMQAHMVSQLEEAPYVPLGLVQYFADSLTVPYLREAALTVVVAPAHTAPPAAETTDSLGSS